MCHPPPTPLVLFAQYGGAIPSWRDDPFANNVDLHHGEDAEIYMYIYIYGNLASCSGRFAPVLVHLGCQLNLILEKSQAVVIASHGTAIGLWRVACLWNAHMG